MRYLSVCSGIEAASVAWDSLGLECVGVSEIEPFPSAVLKYHYPEVKNFGDFTQIKESDFDKPIDLLVGGTPCQSFSIAGKRLGLGDSRGNLAIEFIRLAKRLHPTWILWENVPGVLSSDKGRDFGTFLSLLEKCGYRWAYRVLDAQYFGVPQRRRRVFLVGYIGDWRPPTAVLFESKSVSRNFEKSKKTGCVSPTIPACDAGTDRPGGQGAELGFYIPEITHTVTTREGSHHDPTLETFMPTINGVRRLTPIECERLQGFPYNWTDIPWKGKDHSPDSLRYKAIGNSMAVPVMKWIGERMGIADTMIKPNYTHGGIYE